MRVFARKGYHASRVGDIAEEAGVAYGLLYHYFESKEDVLRSVFRETWRALIETIESVEEAGDPPREQLRKVAEILLRSWRRDPDLVRVLVLEVTRSQHLPGEMDEIVASFAAIQEIVERGQADGTIRADLDARLASYVFYGAVEELLTGWVLGRLPDSEDDVARAERTLVEIVSGGLSSDLAPARAWCRPHRRPRLSSPCPRSSGDCSGRSVSVPSGSRSRSPRPPPTSRRCCTASRARAA